MLKCRNQIFYIVSYTAKTKNFTSPSQKIGFFSCFRPMQDECQVPDGLREHYTGKYVEEKRQTETGMVENRMSEINV